MAERLVLLTEPEDGRNKKKNVASGTKKGGGKDTVSAKKALAFV